MKKWRVNRPYENEAAEMVKPHGFVLDFVGFVPNHGKLWKSLMRAHLGEYEKLDKRLRHEATKQ